MCTHLGRTGAKWGHGELHTWGKMGYHNIFTKEYASERKSESDIYYALWDKHQTRSTIFIVTVAGKEIRYYLMRSEEKRI